IKNQSMRKIYLHKRFDSFPEIVLGIFDINIINVVLQLIKYNDELSPADMRRYIAGYLTRTPLQFLGLMQ
ncbi:hypothetical protein ABC626_05545, partial [Lactobacillus helveticus]